MNRPSAGDADITIDPEGRVSLAHAQAVSRTRTHSGRWQLGAHGPDLLLLRRADRSVQGALAGEVLEPTMLLEVIQLIANGRWSGELLHVSAGLHGDGRITRTLVFDHGAVIFGSSSHPPERLGEVMLRRGRVSREVLDAIAPSLGHQRRIGELLVERGILRPTEVFAMLECLVEEVFHNLVRDARGSFVFTRGLDASALQVRVNLQTSGLLMETVQRLDEWQWLRAKIPDTGVVPVRTDAPLNTDLPLDSLARALGVRIDGTRTLQDLATVLGVSDFEATKALHSLMSTGQVALAPRRSPDEAITEIVEGVNRVLREVYDAVDARGGGDETREMIALFVESGGAVGALVEQAPRPDGTLDPDSLRAKSAEHPGRDRVAMVRQCLYDYVNFALFAAGTVMDREAHRQLALRVQSTLEPLKT